MDAPDYGLIDRLGAGGSIFYPRRDRRPAPPGALDLLVAVPNTDGVELACRFYPRAIASPSILFFHGNGEVAADYDEMAPIYHEAGFNLWVADYRGYGASSGTPSFAALVADAHPVLDAFHGLLDEQGYADHRFVMGRSLGGHPALELAARRPERLRGLVIESGATGLDRLLRLAGDDPEARRVADQHREKVESIFLPVLVIHGDEDELIPVERAIAFHAALTTPDKRLCIIPGAGHNDISWVGMEQYFTALAEFAARP